MKLLGLRRCKPMIFSVLVCALFDFSQAGPAMADLLAPDAPSQPSGFSIEDRQGAPLEWETVPAESAESVWNRAADWAKEQLTQSDDAFFNTRTLNSAYDDLWWLKAIQAPAAWGLSTGRGVTVAVVDTGIDYTHEDLSGNVWTNVGEIAGNGIDDDGNGYVDDWRGWDFANNDNNATDDQGHGTHVAGIIGAAAGNGKGIAGVAPDSKILGVKVLDKTGSGSFENIVKGIRYAVDMGARIINLSLGAAFNYTLDYIRTNFSGYYEAFLQPMQTAIQYAAGKGAVVVAAAGNSAIDVNRTAPAGFTETISVGATTPTEGRAYFSNTGQTLDLSAPGWDVLSLRAAGTSLGTAVDAGYTRASGTSMATPMVSGVIALLLAQDPDLNIEGIERRLKYSAKDLGGSGFDTSFGYGQVDALNAVTHDYFADGKLKTLWLLAPDAQNMVRYDYDAQGRVISSVSADGKKHMTEYDSAGNRIERFPNGRIKTRTDAVTGTIYEYLDEDLDGLGTQRVFRSTDVDGTKKEYTYWYKTTTVKTRKTYDASGKLIQSEGYDSIGRLTSTESGADRTEYTYWGATSTVRTLRTKKNSVLTQTDSFDSNGRLTSRSVYSGTDRTDTSYYLSGLAREVTLYKNSIRASVTRYFESGVKSFWAVYENGQLALSESYDAEGRLRVKTLISGTLKTETTYYLSGKPRQVSVWKGSLRDSVTQYYESGIISYLALYQNGRIASETFYKTDGKVQRSKTYK